MDVAILTGLVIAITGCVGVWLQFRSVRVSEQQLRSQIQSMQTVLDKIQAERREREAAVAQVEAQLAVIDSGVRDTHHTNWDHASVVGTLQSMQTSKLALGTSMFAHTSSLVGGLDSRTRERLEVVADFALAISAMAELDAKFAQEMSKWRYLNRAGQTAETPEEVSARFAAERRRVVADFSAASERFAKAFRPETA